MILRHLPAGRQALPQNQINVLLIKHLFEKIVAVLVRHDIMLQY